VARAYRRDVGVGGVGLLDYGEARGAPRLRRALAAMLASSRGLSASPEQLIVTRGSQQALWLAARALITPGERIAVESLGYPPAWDAFRDAGAALVPLALDGEGVRVEAVEAALREGPLRALYLTPHHQYPTMVALSARRKLRLLELSRLHRFAILEDDYSHEFQYEGRPRLPMASADPSGQVVYVGSLSKILAPGLRIGYAVAPQPLIERMAGLRTFVDRQGDAIAEAAIAELLEDGEVARHARRMRGVYEGRRAALIAALERELGERVSFGVPQGGMALWIEVRGVKPEAWAERALARGVVFRAGSALALDGKSIPFVRMGFTRLDEREIGKAVREAARAWG
jgi:GntR family transcriptional regulator/MocR family aminotransferase